MSYIAILDETLSFSKDELNAALDALGVADVTFDVCAAEFAAMAAIARLRMKISNGAVDDYAIFTNDPARYAKHAVVNNLVDCSCIDAVNAAKQAKWIFEKFGRAHPMQDNIWFIADPHFSHANIVKYCHRPFSSVEEMDAELVARWNARVKKDDVIWCLGDFAFGPKDNVKKFVSRLNGKIKLVMGNHDCKKVSFYQEAGFYRVYDHPVLISSNILLSHIPCNAAMANGSGIVNIYGHVHDSMLYDTVTSNSACCCVERWNYAPVSWKEIREAMAATLSNKKKH